MKLTPHARGRLALALLGLLVLATLGPFVIGRDARHLSAYRDGGEDVSRLRAELAATGARIESLVSSPSLLAGADHPEEQLLVIVGVERRYSAFETAAVVAFLEAGGNVLLADESSYGNDIAKAAGYAFTSTRVLDRRNHHGEATLPVVDARLGTDSYRVVFNAPSAIVALVDDATPEVLAWSSSPNHPEGSFLDANDNREIDIHDRAGPFPLIVRARVGEGTIILVSDTGLFMNGQIDLAGYDNARLSRALALALGAGDRAIVLDESRHAPPPGLAAWNALARGIVRATDGAAGLLTVAALVAGAVIAWRMTRPTVDWSHHDFHIGESVPAPASIAPDVERLQRFARRRINEKFNIPMEQVQAMTAEELVALTGDRPLSDAAAGAPPQDTSPLLRTLVPEASQ